MILMLKSSGEYRNAKTVITTDVRTNSLPQDYFILMLKQVIFALKRLGRPIYGTVISIFKVIIP